MNVRPEGLTLAEFPEWEAAQQTKHEYVRGVVSPFPGGTLARAKLAGEIYASLLRQLRGTAFDAYIFDVMTVTPDSVRYPDVVVTRGERETRNPKQRTLTRPVLIVEVLSDSTEADDRGAKFADYRSLASFEEYVLADSRRRRVERFRHEGGWAAEAAASTGRLRLGSLEAVLDIDELYDNAEIAAD